MRCLYEIFFLAMKNMRADKKWQKSEKTLCTRKPFCQEYNTFNVWWQT